MNYNYIIIGDSITYGIGDEENGGWAAIFKRYIVNKVDSQNCNNFVHIAGFPGATSSDVLYRLENILNSYLKTEYKNVVILSIGINDTQEFCGENLVTIDQYKSNLEKILKYIVQQNAELIVLGLTRIECDESYIWKPNNYSDNKEISEYDRDLQAIIDYDNVLKKFCETNKIKYIPMQDVLNKEDFVDGLHPDSTGHRKMFERVINNL